MNNLLLIFLTIASFFIGLLYGGLSLNPKIISERLQLCEEKGGKYNLTWAEWDNEYNERCEVTEDTIKLP